MENNSIFIEKLRSSGLRPTKQRIKICEVLFDTDKTFHFTIKELVKIIENQANIKVSLAIILKTMMNMRNIQYCHFECNIYTNTTYI